MKKRPRCAAAGGVGVLGALVTAIVIAYFLSLPLPLPWEGFALVFEMICEFLLILAAVRAKKRAVALKEEAAEEIGMAQTPKSA